MSQEVDLSIIERVKRTLRVEGENNPLVLIVLLRKHRNSFHPDIYTDDLAKKEAEKNFKELNELIEALDSYIQRDRLSKSPMELALYQPLYDNSSLQAKIDELQGKIERLESLNRYNDSKIRDLENELAEKHDKEMEELAIELEKQYKPSSNKIVSVGLAIVLSGLMPIFAKIEAISELLKKYAPFSTNQMNFVMFIIFSLSIAVTIIKFIEYHFLKDKIALMKSPIYIRLLFSDQKEKKAFSESEVYQYISGKEHIIKKVSRLLGFRYYKPDTIIQLKDVFISNLLNKKLIEIAYAENLDRHFRIKTRMRYQTDIYEEEE